MRRRTTTKLWVCTGGVLLAASAGHLQAQLAVTGNLTTTAVIYGSPAPGTAALATQTINTSFGDNTSSTGHLNGSELDAAYGTVEGGYLYLFIAGNIQDNGNPIDIWIDDGRPGQTTLAAPTGAGNMHNENGSVFSSGFQATYALELNTTDVTPNTNGNFFVDQYTLTGTPNATFLGQFGLTGGIGTSKEAGSTESAILVGVNNTNTGGVVGDANGGADIPPTHNLSPPESNSASPSPPSATPQAISKSSPASTATATADSATNSCPASKRAPPASRKAPTAPPIPITSPTPNSPSPTPPTNSSQSPTPSSPMAFGFPPETATGAPLPIGPTALCRKIRAIPPVSPAPPWPRP
jgi:hypothetical protein